MHNKHEFRLEANDRSNAISDFLEFLLVAKQALKKWRVGERDPRVQQIRSPLEEHYLDDQGKPAMYQRIESALYDDSPEMVTLWQLFDSYDRDRLRAYQRLLKLEHEGLTGDRHPRKIFDRSPFGIVAIIVGTITIWMTALRTFTGEDLGELLELIHFNWVAGTIWIVGLFVVLWYILKTLRNNQQVAFLSSLDRALTLYLDDELHHGLERTLAA